jgi:hypothetical protein
MHITNAFHRMLPRRIWWPWTQPASIVWFERNFPVPRPVDAVLYVSASGPYTAYLDGKPLEFPESQNPSWRVMHVLPFRLTAGAHHLAFEVQAGSHGQPFFLACLDWDDNGNPERLGTDESWRMSVDPEAEWQPAWAFDGVWAEPWGFPCNAPIDFGRMGTGWQQVVCQALTRVSGLFQGLVTQGGSARLLPGGAVQMVPAWPHANQPPAIENTRPRLEWYRTREAHSLIYNTWLEMFDQRAPHVVLDTGETTFAACGFACAAAGRPCWQFQPASH